MSRQVTSSPRSASSGTSRRPMKPVPPMTRVDIAVPPKGLLPRRLAADRRFRKRPAAARPAPRLAFVDRGTLAVATGAADLGRAETRSEADVRPRLDAGVITPSAWRRRGAGFRIIDGGRISTRGEAGWMSTASSSSENSASRHRRSGAPQAPWPMPGGRPRGPRCLTRSGSVARTSARLGYGGVAQLV